MIECRWKYEEVIEVKDMISEIGMSLEKVQRTAVKFPGLYNVSKLEQCCDNLMQQNRSRSTFLRGGMLNY